MRGAPCRRIQQGQREERMFASFGDHAGRTPLRRKNHSKGIGGRDRACLAGVVGVGGFYNTA